MPLLAFVALLMAPAGSPPTEIPVGRSDREFDLGGTTIRTFLYKPESYRPAEVPDARLIVVMHGVDRNADDYRNDSEAMAKRFGALIAAPMFDAERFPSRRYQRGGILRKDGTAAPKSEWTYRFLPSLAQKIREIEGRPRMPYSLVGHSAGGQFLVRLAGFFDPGAERIVAANPGSELFPTREQKFGYGFGGLPAALSNDDTIRAYLARPLTIYLGTADRGHDENLDESTEAMVQGPGRLQRGRAAFASGQALARARGWPFGWRLVETPGVGHDHREMFGAPEMAYALRLRR